MIVHELKIESRFFGPVAVGTKPFEIRKNDRNYRVNDVLVLRECNEGVFTGHSVVRQISCVSEAFQQDGYVVLGICRCD